jgi:hypothetical protein
LPVTTNSNLLHLTTLLAEAVTIADGLDEFLLAARIEDTLNLARQIMHGNTSSGGATS